MTDLFLYAWLLALTIMVWRSGRPSAPVPQQAAPHVLQQAKDGARMMVKLAAKREQYRGELERLHSPDPEVKVKAALDIIKRRQAERAAP